MRRDANERTRWSPWWRWKTHRQWLLRTSSGFFDIYSQRSSALMILGWVPKKPQINSLSINISFWIFHPPRICWGKKVEEMNLITILILLWFKKKMNGKKYWIIKMNVVYFFFFVYSYLYFFNITSAIPILPLYHEVDKQPQILFKMSWWYLYT